MCLQMRGAEESPGDLKGWGALRACGLQGRVLGLMRFRV